MRAAGEPYTITPRDLLRKVRALTFDTAKEAAETITREEGKAISCSAGCAYCCYQKILIDAAEGALIYLHLRDRWTAALEQRLVQADREMTATAHGQWLGLRRPCVFLKEEGFGRGRCQVYPVRPVACAVTHSVGTPADCAVVGGVNQVAALTPAAGRLGKLNIELALGFGDLDARTIPGAVLVARAALEGLPEPQVHSAPHLEGGVEERFDQAAKG